MFKYSLVWKYYELVEKLLRTHCRIGIEHHGPSRFDLMLHKLKF